MIRIFHVPMHDGIRLFTTAYFPESFHSGTTSFPVVLFRSLYNHPNHIAPESEWTDKGFVFVNQDVRCSARSQGDEWDPWMQERQDGADMLDWLTQQPWCNGRICMIGESYCGEVQLTAAQSGHPALVGCSPFVVPSDFYGSTMYTGGAFLLALNAGWALGSNANCCGIPCNPEHPPLEEMLTHLPIRELDQKGYGFKSPVAFWHKWLDHPEDSEFWDPYRFSGRVNAFRCPMLFASGWFDIYTKDTFNATTAVRTSAATPLARSATRCVMGPWTHSFALCGYPIEDVANASRENALQPVEKRFVEQILQHPSEDPLPDMPAFRYFVLGSEQWKSSSVWPPANAIPSSFYLSTPCGSANSAKGNGRLLAESPPAAEAPDAYIYDPMNPVKTNGGHAICCTPGSQDQTEREQRTDVLVFQTAPLEKPLAIEGNVTLELFAASSAPDTDFIATLTDIFPDGRTYNLCNGIIRARYRNGFRSPEPLPLNEPVLLSIDLWAIAVQFKAGHRIGLEITSSDFPHFDRNLNTGTPNADAVEPVIARQLVFHDAEHPSRLLLPVIKE
ncbi:MAG: CocE/NonD family hydrolase [Kiritimatiellia bacterium]